MLTTRVDGEEVHGSPRVQSSFAVDTLVGTASAIVLLDSIGGEHVLWVDINGTLKIGTRTDLLTPDSAGTTVGSQV